MAAFRDSAADAFINLVHAEDTAGFLALFAPGGFVDDWGRTFVGPAEITRWSDAEFIGAHGRMTDVRLSTTGSAPDRTVTVVAQWTSQRHIGPSTFVLHYRDGTLVSLTISAA